jgi:hypothetical protein
VTLRVGGESFANVIPREGVESHLLTSKWFLGFSKR